MNNDDATIYNNDENLSYSVFDDLHYFKKPWNLRVFPLSNVWWVDIHSTLTICLFCTRCLKERQRKVNLSDRISYALVVLVYINVQKYPISHKLLPWYRIKTVDCRYCYTHAFKIAHARKTCLCFLNVCKNCFLLIIIFILLVNYFFKEITGDVKNQP